MWAEKIFCGLSRAVLFAFGRLFWVLVVLWVVLDVRLYVG